MYRLVLDAGYADVEDVEEEVKGYRLASVLGETDVVVSEQEGVTVIILTGEHKAPFYRFAEKFFGSDFGPKFARGVVDDRAEVV